MDKREELQLAYDKLMDAAKALAAVDDINAEMLAEEVIGHAGLIDVLITEAGDK